jgi:hypothetical protein
MAIEKIEIWGLFWSKTAPPIWPILREMGWIGSAV